MIGIATAELYGRNSKDCCRTEREIDLCDCASIKPTSFILEASLIMLSDSDRSLLMVQSQKY